MLGQSLKHDLQDFVQFATRRIEGGVGNESVEDLVLQWRRDSEYAAAVADVRQGLADDVRGQSESVPVVFDDIRRRLEIDE